jgi:hypothetical protein
MAPYLRESREFVKRRESSRRGNRSALGSAAEPREAPLTHRQEAKSALDARLPLTSRREGPSEATLRLSTAHSKPLISAATGLTSMTPLGPALGSVRSFSRSRVEQHSARQQAQRELGRKAKLEILSHLEARAAEMQEEALVEAAQGVEQGRRRPKQKLLSRLATER